MSLVKVYFLNEREEAATRQAVQDGILRDAEITETYALGSIDEADIDKLTSRGVVVSGVEEALPPTISTVSATDLRNARSEDRSSLVVMNNVIGSTTATQAEAMAMPPFAGDERFRLLVAGPITEDRRLALDAAGARDLERDASGWYVARAEQGPSPLSALPFISAVRPYGPDETLAPPGLGQFARGPLANAATHAANSALARRSGPGRRFEALLHANADSAAARGRIEGLGATVSSAVGRVVRFALPSSHELRSVAALPEVANVHEVRPARLLHDFARRIIGASDAVGAPASIPYDGEGEVIGVADTGIDVNHEDFKGRIRGIAALGRQNDASDPSGHGTHVAGTVLGDGSASGGRLAGIAPRAALYFQSILDVNGELGGLPAPLNSLFAQAYAEGVRVHNNSWGAFLHSRYAGMSLEVDEFVAQHRDFLPVIAAGNDGSCRPGWHSMSGFVDYPSLAAPATAKNALTVGASRSDRTSGGYAALTYGQTWAEDFDKPPVADETVSGDAQGVAAFSGRGPCDDMRIKPDVVAPGTDIASTRSSQAPLRNFWGAYPKNSKYAFNGGTSMACPVVTGCVALARQYFVRDRAHHPSAALLKASIVNGTVAMTAPSAEAPPEGFPNYHQGFGRVDLRKTLPNPNAPAFALAFVDTWKEPDRQLVRTGQNFQYRLALDRDGELRVCLVWTDLPARSLQNSLLLVLDNELGTKWIGNDRAAAPLTFEGVALIGATGRLRRDPSNNVQVIRLPLAPAGSYTLAIVADNLLRGPQDFALVASGAISNFARS